VRSRTPPAIRTDGVYAVAIRWARSEDDVDLYVQDPGRRGLLLREPERRAAVARARRPRPHSERAGVRLGYEHERAVLRGVVAGEFVVNVHGYRLAGPAHAVRVTVELWRLRGDDRVLVREHVMLARTGDERTAFRFQLDARGRLRGLSRLQKRLVGAAGE
jgi:hypothetical protein